MKNRICTICARAGSRRLPDKNIYPVMGAPLMAYSIAVAQASGLFQRVVVTSDSPEYLECGLEWGADDYVIRPAELATSKIGKVFGIAHAVAETEAKNGTKYDTIVDLDVTAPLRRVNDIKNVVAQLENGPAEAVISATEAKSTPFSNLFFMAADCKMEPMVSQEKVDAHTDLARPCYALNASIYAWDRNVFLLAPATFYPRTELYVMPSVSRYDVDSQEDVEYVSHVLEKKSDTYTVPKKERKSTL